MNASVQVCIGQLWICVARNDIHISMFMGTFTHVLGYNDDIIDENHLTSRTCVRRALRSNAYKTQASTHATYVLPFDEFSSYVSSLWAKNMYEHYQHFNYIRIWSSKVLRRGLYVSLSISTRFNAHVYADVGSTIPTLVMSSHCVVHLCIHIYLYTCAKHTCMLMEEVVCLGCVYVLTCCFVHWVEIL